MKKQILKTKKLVKKKTMIDYLLNLNLQQFLILYAIIAFVFLIIFSIVDYKSDRPNLNSIACIALAICWGLYTVATILKTLGTIIEKIYIFISFIISIFLITVFGFLGIVDTEKYVENYKYDLRKKEQKEDNIEDEQDDKG